MVNLTVIYGIGVILFATFVAILAGAMFVAAFERYLANIETAPFGVLTDEEE